MAFEAPVDEFDPNANFDTPPAGQYHVQIVKVDEEGGQRGEMVVDYEVLDGNPQGHEGKIHRDYFSKTIKAMKRIHQLAIACGMVTVDQLNEMKERGQSPTYDFENDALNKQICVDLFDEEYNGKTKVKAGFGLYHVTDPKVEKWRKNVAMLQNIGVKVEPPKADDDGGDETAPFDLGGIV